MKRCIECKDDLYSGTETFGELGILDSTGMHPECLKIASERLARIRANEEM